MSRVRPTSSIDNWIFTGRNVVQFITRFEIRCKAEGLAKDKMVEAFALNVSPRVWSEVTAMQSYQKQDWPTLKRDLVDTFVDDLAQVYTLSDLVHLVKHTQAADPPKTYTSILRYSRKFSRMATYLKAKGILSKHDETRLFLRGIDRTFKRRLQTAAYSKSLAARETERHFRFLRQRERRALKDAEAKVKEAGYDVGGDTDEEDEDVFGKHIFIPALQTSTVKELLCDIRELFEASAYDAYPEEDSSDCGDTSNQEKDINFVKTPGLKRGKSPQWISDLSSGSDSEHETRQSYRKRKQTDEQVLYSDSADDLQGVRARRCEETLRPSDTNDGNSKQAKGLPSRQSLTYDLSAVVDRLSKLELANAWLQEEIDARGQN